MLRRREREREGERGREGAIEREGEKENQGLMYTKYSCGRGRVCVKWQVFTSERDFTPSHSTTFVLSQISIHIL